jgi:hypothetical protein
VTRFWEQLPETPANVDFGRLRIELNGRLRAAFLAGVERQSRRDHGRGLTDEELQRIIRRYPADLPDR